VCLSLGIAIEGSRSSTCLDNRRWFPAALLLRERLLAEIHGQSPAMPTGEELRLVTEQRFDRT
jgi:hypothetical protein